MDVTPLCSNQTPRRLPRPLHGNHTPHADVTPPTQLPHPFTAATHPTQLPHPLDSFHTPRQLPHPLDSCHTLYVTVTPLHSCHTPTLLPHHYTAATPPTQLPHPLHSCHTLHHYTVTYTLHTPLSSASSFLPVFRFLTLPRAQYGGMSKKQQQKKTHRGAKFPDVAKINDYPLIWHLERHSDNNSRENPITACILGGQFQVAVRAVLVVLSPSKFSPIGYGCNCILIDCRLISSVYISR